MTDSPDLTLQVAEIIHYSADIPAAIEYYHGQLGWPLVIQMGDNLAVLDAGGAYQLTVVTAAWTPDWEPGKPVPGPQLSLESTDLAADCALLEQRGLAGLEIGGDPVNMPALDIPGPENLALFTWQDLQAKPGPSAIEKHRAQQKPEDVLYTLGECLLFVEDLPAAESFFIDKLGFSVKERHEDLFTALRRGEGPVVGVYHRPRWWEAPDELPVMPVRLFLECPDLKAEHARQVAAGANPGAIKEKGAGLSWFSSTDPDGNTITFWQFKPTTSDSTM